MDAFRDKVRMITDFVLRRSLRQVAPALSANEGMRAEELASDFLCAMGARILARNVRCRGGEIDLVVLIGGTLVFVEVRKRKNKDFGGAAASITREKQMRIVLASRHWLAGAGKAHAARPCRFDAVLLDRLFARRHQVGTGRVSARLNAALLALSALAFLSLREASAQARYMLLHTTRLAGFTYHEAPVLFSQLRVGDALALEAEPGNPHDALAVKVLWHGHLLGYLPARENAPVSQALQQGKPLAARIQALRDHPDPRERLRIDITMPIACD